MDKAIKILEQIHRKAAIIIKRYYYLRETAFKRNRMLQELKLLTLQQRRKDARLTFLTKSVRGWFQEYLVKTILYLKK